MTPTSPTALPFLMPPLPAQTERRLLLIAAAFVFLLAVALTLSPAVRLRTWAVDYRWTHWMGFAAWALAFFIAQRELRHRLPEHDPYLLPVIALLSGWGLLTIWRLDAYFGLRQTFWLIVALLLFTLGLRLAPDLGFLRRYKYLWLTGGLLLTALTLLFGTNPQGFGPRLWLGCCGLYLQPSEPLKLLLIVYISAYLAEKRFGLFSAASRSRLGLDLALLAPTLVLAGLALALLVVQRDLGTASIFLFLYAALVYLASGQPRAVLVGALSVGLAGLAGYLLFDVVRLRIDAWLNPWLDPSGRSYQIVQALIAIANGGLIGRGPGLGSPGLVPVPHSDFIFTAIAEETGLLGALGLLVLLALLVVRGLSAALNASSVYQRYLAAGLTAYLAGQSILIIGGNLRLLPLTGVTLPFVSYGGSSLVTSFISALLLLLISAPSDQKHVLGGSLTTLHLQPAALRPYRLLGLCLLSGLAAAGLAHGWWALYRAPALLARTDNARRALADLYVPRGALLDRHNTPLVATTGQPGQYTRFSSYPALGPIIGYTNLIYGQSGLEASLDPWLRGLSGNPTWRVWWENLVYGQPPAGLSLRLSLDLPLQRQTDAALGAQAGAIVVLNAQSGELLALASHPTFNPNTIAATWAALVQAPGAPLLNRTTQSQYSPGAALSPLLLTALYDQEAALPTLPGDLSYLVYGAPPVRLDCAQPPAAADWPASLAAGCPGATAALAQALGRETLLKLFAAAGLYNVPDARLPAAPPSQLDLISPAAQLALGQAISDAAADQALRLSPLQAALALAPLSAAGQRPAPLLALAVDTPQAGWVLLSPDQAPVQVLTARAAQRAAAALASPTLPAWETLAIAPNGPDQFVTWYLAGTLPDWQGAPLVIVVALEANAPAEAQAIGQQVIEAALGP